MAFKKKTQEIDWFKFLTTHFFAFGRETFEPYTNAMIFKENGSILFGTEVSGNEFFWRIEDGNLYLENQAHEVTTLLALPDDSEQALRGAFLAEPAIKHYVRLTQPQLAQVELTQQAVDKLAREYEGTKQLKLPIGTQVHKRARIAFIINSPETISALLPLMRAVQASADFESRVIVVERFFSGVLRSGVKEQLSDYLKVQGIRLVDTSDDNAVSLLSLQKWQADYLVRQSEWDADFPREFAQANLQWTKLIHIAYVITENFLFEPDNDKPMFTHSYYEGIWRSFIALPLSEKEKAILDTTFISSDVFEAVGSMKAIEIYNMQAEWPQPEAKAKVIWMPHHSIGDDWFKFGTFLTVAEDIYQWAKAHPEISIVLNPHPSLAASIEKEQLDFSIASYDEFIQRWQTLPNTSYLVKQGSYPAIAAADVILTDGISILFEGQILSKPIIFIEREGHVDFTDVGSRFMQGVHHVKHVDRALELVERLLHAPDELKQQQAENVAPWLVNSQPELTIMQSILNDFAQK